MRIADCGMDEEESCTGSEGVLGESSESSAGSASPSGASSGSASDSWCALVAVRGAGERVSLVVAGFTGWKPVPLEAFLSEAGCGGVRESGLGGGWGTPDSKTRWACHPAFRTIGAIG